MSNQVLYFLIVLVQNFIIVTYLDNVFDYRFGRKLTNVVMYIFLYLLFLVTTPIINLKPLKLLIITVTQTIFFKLMSKNSWKESIKKTIILVLLTMLAEIISDVIYSTISYFNNSRLDLDTASTFDTLRILSGTFILPVFMCIILTFSIFYRKIKGSIRRRLILLLFLIPIMMIFIHYVLYSYNIETFSTTTLWFIFISSFISTLILLIIYRVIVKVEEYTKKEKELDLLKQKEKMQLEYYKIMQDKEEEIRKINHDIKNNLQVIYTLKNDSDNKKLIDKINSNLKKYELVKYSKQDILNIILNTKVNEAKSKEINIEITLKKSVEFMEDLDVSNLFSNILDNAIENACNAKEKFIKLSITSKMNCVLIECINSYDGIIYTDISQKLKTKKDSTHGYGLKIIDSIIKKYKGEKTISYDDKNFTITLLIPNTKN